MKLQILYILNCPWCLGTKKLVKESLAELGITTEIEEILIDSDEKAKKYNFIGSPTVRINGNDIQEQVEKGKCVSCEKLSETDGTAFTIKESKCGCRMYRYKGKQYPFPPKEMIKEAIRKNMK